jgi:hypothetical protein
MTALLLLCLKHLGLREEAGIGHGGARACGAGKHAGGDAGVRGQDLAGRAVDRGQRGTTCEFRGDGTLIVSSPGSTPLAGSWKWHEGNLTMTEEGIDYPTDILALDDSTFKIRSNNPGQPVEITLRRDTP